MSLSHRQQHQLYRIEADLLQSDPQLAAMLGVSGRLSAGRGHARVGAHSLQATIYPAGSRLRRRGDRPHGRSRQAATQRSPRSGPRRRRHASQPPSAGARSRVLASRPGRSTAASTAGVPAMTTVEYALHGADNHTIIKRITLPDADAARSYMLPDADAARAYMQYLARLGIDSPNYAERRRGTTTQGGSRAPLNAASRTGRDRRLRPPANTAASPGRPGRRAHRDVRWPAPHGHPRVPR